MWQMTGGWRRAAGTAIAFFVAFRALTEGIALIAAQGQGAARNLLHHPSTAVDVWAHWDGNWYIAIAQQGYPPLSPTTGGSKTYDAVAFMPAYPALVRAVHVVVPLSWPAAGLLVSGLCLVAALAGLYRLVEIDHGRKTAATTLFLLLVFPSSFFLGGIYAEALVLAATVWAFVAARQGRWWLAGAMAGIAVLSKLYMVVLVIALLVEYLDSKEWQRPRIRPDIAWIVAIPTAALGAWMVYLQVQFHDPLRFLTAEKYWDRHAAPPWVGLLDAVKTLLGFHFVGLVDLASIVIFVAATVYCIRHLRPAYGTLLVLGLAVLVSSSTIYSSNRLMIVFFPVFLVGALLVQRRAWLERAIVVTSVPLAVFLVARFATGQWAG